jgi:hypothetical protein
MLNDTFLIDSQCHLGSDSQPFPYLVTTYCRYLREKTLVEKLVNADTYAHDSRVCCSNKREPPTQTPWPLLALALQLYWYLMSLS